MRATQHRTNNLVLGAPPDWDQGSLPCSAIPVTKATLEGSPVIISFWQPTPEEVQQLANGGLIALWVIGDTMPPVSLNVEDKK